MQMFRRPVQRTVAAVSVLALVLLAAGSARAVIDITIEEGRVDALPIAIVPFGWEGGSAPQPPEAVEEVIASDLRRSGRFAPVPFGDLPARPSEGADVRFSDWRLLGTDNLVIGNVRRLASGQFQVRFRLYDVLRAAQLSGFEFTVGPADLRRTAHHIADLVYEQLTGERGAFNTRIAYVTETGAGTDDRRYALNVADSDGFNAATVLESTQPVMSPDWSPDGGRLAYVSFEGRRPQIFVQDLATGGREEVAAFPGLNGAPSWSPDGTRLALTLSKDGNPEIYILHLASRRLQRVTDNAAIDTEPDWAPDGKSLVFTSDRGGRPQVYRVSAFGGRAERVTFQGNYNARATFSPDGSKLALVHSDGDGFRIALLDLQNNALRILSDSRLDESPSFAPNGSMILYATTDTRGVALAAVSVDGRVRHRLAVGGTNLREPAWSPFRALR